MNPNNSIKEEKIKAREKALQTLAECKDREAKLAQQGRLKIVQIDRNTTLIVRDNQSITRWQEAREASTAYLSKSTATLAPKHQETQAPKATKRRLKTPEYAIQQEVKALRLQVQHVVKNERGQRPLWYTREQRQTLHNAVHTLRDLHGWTYPEIGEALGLSKSRVADYYDPKFLELGKSRKPR